MKPRLIVFACILAAIIAIFLWWRSGGEAEPEKVVFASKVEAPKPTSAPMPNATSVAAPGLPVAPKPTGSDTPRVAAQPTQSGGSDGQTEAAAIVQDMVARLKSGDAASVFENYGPPWVRDNPPSDIKAGMAQIVGEQSANLLQVLESMVTQTPNIQGVSEETAVYEIIDPVTGKRSTFALFKNNGQWCFDLNAIVAWHTEANH